MNKSVFDNFKKDNLFTIPNILTYLRFLLIPIIVYVYIFKNNYSLASYLVVISLISDVLDGFIARTFNQVTNIGKVIDPIADKATQGAIGLCLVIRFKRLMVIFVIIFLVTQVITLVLAIFTTKKTDNVNSAKWHGKVSTGVVLAGLVYLILFDKQDIIPPFIIINIMIVVVLFNFIAYLIYYIKVSYNHYYKKRR